MSKSKCDLFYPEKETEARMSKSTRDLCQNRTVVKQTDYACQQKTGTLIVAADASLPTPPQAR